MFPSPSSITSSLIIITIIIIIITTLPIHSGQFLECHPISTCQYCIIKLTVPTLLVTLTTKAPPQPQLAHSATTPQSSATLPFPGVLVAICQTTPSAPCTHDAKFDRTNTLPPSAYSTCHVCRTSLTRSKHIRQAFPPVFPNHVQLPAQWTGFDPTYPDTHVQSLS